MRSPNFTAHFKFIIMITKSRFSILKFNHKHTFFPSIEHTLYNKWLALYIYFIHYTIVISANQSCNRLKYVLTKIKSSKQDGGIKLYYKVKHQVPVYLFKYVLFYKTVKTEKVIFWKPLKQHWSTAGKKISYEIGGKTSDNYVQIWLRINRDFNNIYTEERLIGRTIEEFIYRTRNKEMFYLLNQSTSKILINF